MLSEFNTLSLTHALSELFILSSLCTDSTLDFTERGKELLTKLLANWSSNRSSTTRTVTALTMSRMVEDVDDDSSSTNDENDDDK